MRLNRHIHLPSSFVLSLLLLVSLSDAANAQGTAFSYQGKLADGGVSANGQYDFQFKLFDTQTVGTGAQQGSLIGISNVTVTAGVFTVQLDFGACATCFDGSPRFLEIAVKPVAGPTFTTLGPRQPIASTPYALKSVNATVADGLSLTCVNCITSDQIANVNGSAVAGAIPVASVPAGSGSYVQNSTTQQTASNFNISGDGTAGGALSANVVNATSQFNLGGQRVIAGNTPLRNTFLGVRAGEANPSGLDDSFFGYQSGKANTSGFHNSFFGSFAGEVNTSGSDNSCFGYAAGGANTAGAGNSFFGSAAGAFNIGSNNSFFGAAAGNLNATGTGNSFFGRSAGNANTTGASNTVIGFSAGTNNTTGGSLTIIGSSADVGLNNLINAGAIGSRAFVAQSNSLVLGSISGVNGATADNSVGIGTTSPGAVLDVQRDGGAIAETARFTTFGTDNEILGRASGGTRAAPTAAPSGRNLLVLGGTGHDGTNFSTGLGGSVNIISTEAWTSAAHGTRISFRTTPKGSTGTLTRMTVADDGNVGIGTTGPSAALEVRGDVKLGPSGQFFASGGSENLRVLRGEIRDNGTIEFGGGGFTASRLGTGHYLITFGTPFADVPTVIVSPFYAGGTLKIATWTAPLAESIEVQTWFVTGVAVDSTFNIVIVGPR